MVACPYGYWWRISTVTGPHHAQYPPHTCIVNSVMRRSIWHHLVSVVFIRIKEISFLSFTRPGGNDLFEGDV